MKLKVIDSQTQSELQELDLFLAIRMEGEYLIGRSPNSGLVLDSPDVSRQHGKFLLQDGNYYYCDLGSKNGSLVNGKIVETNQKYVLKHGDIIRLGEFALMLEEMTLPDLAETVFRVVDATVISNSLQNQQIPALPQEEEEVPEVAQKEVLDSKTPDSQQIGQQNTTEEPAPEAVDRQAAPVSSELTYVQIDEHTFIQPQQLDSQQTGQSTNEEQAPEAVDRQAAPVTSELTYVQIDEYTFIQPAQVANEISESAIATPQSESEVPVVADDVSEQITPDSQQLEQPATEELALEVVEQQAAPASVEPIDVQTDELTSLQPPEENQVPQSAIATPQLEEEVPESVIATPQSEEELPVVVVVADDVSEQITPDSQQLEEAATEEVAFEVVEQQAAPASVEPIDVQTDELTSLQPPEENQVPQSAIATPQLEEEEEVPESAIATPQSEEELPVVVVADDVSEQITPDSQQLEEAATEEVAFEVVEQQAAPASVEPIDVQTDELTSLQPPEENQVPQSAIATPQLEEEVPENVIATPQSKSEVSVVADDVSEQITPASQQIEQPAIEEQALEVVVQFPDVDEDTIESETPEFINKYIVLIAHDSKRSELAEIVAQHQKFFSKCLTLASSSISDLVAQQSGIAISQQIPTSGGYQTIVSMLSSGDVLAVIFLRDLLMPQAGQANEEALLRLCNINNLLVGTNTSTAEAIMHYLETAKR